VHGDIEIVCCIVNRPPAVGGAPGQKIAARGEKNALGARFERNLTDSSKWVLPECDHWERVPAVRAAALHHA
jgi:hypothetical protein